MTMMFLSQKYDDEKSLNRTYRLMGIRTVQDEGDKITTQT